METKQITRGLLMLAALGGLASCGVMEKTTAATGRMMEKTKGATGQMVAKTKGATSAMVGKLPDKNSLASVRDAKWLRGDRPEIARVRQKDLKKFPLGEERAMTAKPVRSFFRPMPPVDYTPGMLPGGDVDPDILLPPL